MYRVRAPVSITGDGADGSSYVMSYVPAVSRQPSSAWSEPLIPAFMPLPFTTARPPAVEWRTRRSLLFYHGSSVHWWRRGIRSTSFFTSAGTGMYVCIASTLCTYSRSI